MDVEKQPCRTKRKRDNEVENGSFPPIHKKQKKARRLDESKTQVIMEWIENHIDSPYLDSESITRLHRDTGLAPRQIQNFVSNYRKRHWPNKDKKTYLRSSSGGYSRNGNWTVPEMQYVSGILEAYYNGALNDIVKGRSVREIIADCLLCKGMRVSKKYPRRMHHSQVVNPIAHSKEYHVAKIQQLRLQFVQSLDAEVQWAYQIDPLQPRSAEMEFSYSIEQQTIDVDLDWDWSDVKLEHVSMDMFDNHPPVFTAL